MSERRGRMRGAIWRRWIGGLGLVALVAPSAGPAAAVGCEVQGLIAGGWDSNPLEWVEAAHRAGDGFTRLEAGLHFHGSDPAAPGGFAGGLRWGSDRYHRWRSENRQILEAQGAWSQVGVRHRLTLFGRLLAHRYAHQSEADRARRGRRDLLRLTGGVSGRWALASGRVLSAQFSLLTLRKEAVRLSGVGGDPAAEEEIGRCRRAAQLTLELRNPLAAGWQLAGRGEVGGLVHDREAAAEPIEGTIRGKGERRRDTTWSLGLSLRRVRGPTLEVGAALVRTASNSFAVASRRLVLTATAGILLPGGVSGHLMGRWHAVTRYDEGEVRLVDPYEDPDDPEFGIRNRVALRLAKPIGEGLSFEVQGSWERNEAIVLLEEYEKIQFWGGIRFRGR